MFSSFSVVYRLGQVAVEDTDKEVNVEGKVLYSTIVGGSWLDYSACSEIHGLLFSDLMTQND